ncbi:MAG: hypothetical protein A2063_01215 [Gallionellales bacterium GWA2_60_142]|nr:MAG: hypothetical protein A2063_01215 [Gallionellales bacterium GWA2_60_142]HCI13960.1 hypothetical protein [Gallionellaceae bacterium]
MGVALGFLLSTLKDWWVQRRKNKKDVEYLSIQIICMLDRYVAGCAAVVSDDGLCRGQPDKDGCSCIQVSTPTFEPEAVKVEWKSLPTKLMYEILMFSNKIEVADNRISAAFEEDHPPDYDEGFGERRYQYAILGIEAAALAEKLRNYAKLPKLQVKHPDEWDAVRYMQDEKRKFDAWEEQRTCLPNPIATDC